MIELVYLTGKLLLDLDEISSIEHDEDDAITYINLGKSYYSISDSEQKVYMSLKNALTLRKFDKGSVEIQRIACEGVLENEDD